MPESTFVEQAGGDHYQAAYQHWDWSVDIDIGCLEYAASKYISRWWKKNGIADINKATTYVDKIIAVYQANKYEPEGASALKTTLTDEFCESAQLPELERLFMHQISSWEALEDLQICKVTLDMLLERAELTAPTLPTQASSNVFQRGLSASLKVSKPKIGVRVRVPSQTGLGMDSPFGFDEDNI